MLLLIAEIVLTILAWNKGWRWKALLPIAIGLGCGFCIGLGIGMSGGSLDSATGISIFFDILIVIALIIMCVKPPKSTIKEEQPKEDEKL